MLHNFCQKVPLSDEDEQATGHNNDADDIYKEVNEMEEGQQKRAEFVRLVFS